MSVSLDVSLRDHKILHSVTQTSEVFLSLETDSDLLRQTQHGRAMADT